MEFKFEITIQFENKGEILSARPYWRHLICDTYTRPYPLKLPPILSVCCNSKFTDDGQKPPNHHIFLFNKNAVKKLLTFH